MAIVLGLLILISLNHCSTLQGSTDNEILIENLDIWPLVTPILGPNLISQECKDASVEYIKLLSDALQYPPSALNESHRNALRRLDSGGPFPFLQEGIMIDTKEYNICWIDLVRKVLAYEHGIYCYDLPLEVQIVHVPYHTAGSPGTHKII